jgi:hypothetical protein
LPAVRADQQVLRQFKDLVYEMCGAAEQIIEFHPVGHETAFVDKLLLDVNSRQPVFGGKLDDPLSFSENWRVDSGIIALTCFYFAVSKALSKPLASAWASMSSIFSFNARAAGLSSFSWRSSPMLAPGGRRSLTRMSLGTASLSISSLLVFSSGAKPESPVSFGRKKALKKQ